MRGEPLRSVTVTRVTGVDAKSDTPRATADDLVVVEEPLDIRVSGDTLAVTMRTPGHDRRVARRAMAERDDMRH